jgi:hypothetical protein
MANDKATVRRALVRKYRAEIVVYALVAFSFVLDIFVHSTPVSYNLPCFFLLEAIAVVSALAAAIYALRNTASKLPLCVSLLVAVVIASRIVVIGCEILLFNAVDSMFRGGFH